MSAPPPAPAPRAPAPGQSAPAPAPAAPRLPDATPGAVGLPAIRWQGTSPCLAAGCSACCHDTEMLLTQADAARLAAARPGLDFHFQADDGYLQLRGRDGPPAPGMKGRPCVFLDEAGRCSVHAERPAGCRLYPAVWDGPRSVRLDSEHCPETRGFHLDPPTQAAVHELVATLRAERKARISAARGGGGPRPGAQAQ